MSRIKATLLAVVIGVASWTMLSRQRPIALADTPDHATPNHATAEAATVAPAEAIRRLQDGNQRFVNQKLTNGERDAARREEISKGQHPFAVVLGCADSRVPPEVIFDQGLGELFVIRVAGEVASPEVIGSIEYAVEHLGCRTIIVLGHERCGAVEAALNTTAGSDTEGNLGQLIKQILPAIDQIDKKSPDALDAAVRANAKNVAKTVATHSKILGELAHKDEIQITSAYYDLDTGKVEFMDKVGGDASEGGH